MRLNSNIFLLFWVAEFSGFASFSWCSNLDRSSPTQGILAQHSFALSRKPRFVTWSHECWICVFLPSCFVQACVVGGD
ncbi:hypothetical protein BDV39DRAFT_63592 [Aspergillus sergii]|uniref:Secreted protein n=1 Tax=Aspergillus sergii TaxID=1034303 RepID=A0A5N6X9V0_9EURO|nr:hypothetical protein BDV39DRAFT_63592 [Aspergillus sergii]